MSEGDGPRTVTLWVVPEGGAGSSRRLVLSLRSIRRVLMGAVAAVVAAAVAVWLVFASLPRAVGYDALVEENLSLRSRLESVEGKLDAVDRELRRLRLYEEQLNAIEPADLPGFGPSDVADGWDDEHYEPMFPEMWGGDTGLTDALPPEEPLLVDPLERVGAAEERADEVLRRLQLIEVELGRVVETAEDYRARSSAVPVAWPLDGVLTSGFGWRRSPFNKRWKFHFGIDISAPVGTLITAPAAGLVVTAEMHSGYGRMLEIDHGYEVVTRYAHNARLLVVPGEVVREGQPIATVGMTGATTGPHLHYEIYVEGQPVDPLEHLE